MARYGIILGIEGRTHKGDWHTSIKGGDARGIFNYDLLNSCNYSLHTK